jgi:hypothetical protein
VVKWRQKEPIYAGKTFHEWFRSIDPYAQGFELDPGVVAIKAMGSEAVPYLINEWRSSVQWRLIIERGRTGLSLVLLKSKTLL